MKCVREGSLTVSDAHKIHRGIGFLRVAHLLARGDTWDGELHCKWVIMMMLCDIYLFVIV